MKFLQGSLNSGTIIFALNYAGYALAQEFRSVEQDQDTRDMQRSITDAMTQFADKNKLKEFGTELGRPALHADI